jgi:putative SOS response-associated peptidase YedK
MCRHYRGHYQLMLPEAGYYPLSTVPVVRLDANGERELVGCQWGFLPGWWRPSDKAPKRAAFQRKCFNARSEDVQVKPTYRDAFKHCRCLLPADEFMEKGHYFHRADNRPFGLAGLWDRWHAGDVVVESCTMLTTVPNALVQSVGHHRMPVMLTSEEQYAVRYLAQSRDR